MRGHFEHFEARLAEAEGQAGSQTVAHHRTEHRGGIGRLAATKRRRLVEHHRPSPWDVVELGDEFEVARQTERHVMRCFGGHGNHLRVVETDAHSSSRNRSAATDTTG